MYLGWGRTKLSAMTELSKRDQITEIASDLFFISATFKALGICNSVQGIRLEIGRAGFCCSHASEQVASLLFTDSQLRTRNTPSPLQAALIRAAEGRRLEPALTAGQPPFLNFPAPNEGRRTWPQRQQV